MIKRKIDWMWDELEKAEEYAAAAHANKETKPELAKTLITLAKDEVKHYEMLRRECLKTIEEHKKLGKEHEHSAYWNCVNEDLAKEHLEVKYYIDQFDRPY